MRKVLIDKIEDGMILGKPLTGATGNILLGEGVPLKASMISRFKNWDIPFVYIQSDDVAVEEAAGPLALATQNNMVDEVFKDVMKNPIMKIIYEAAKEYQRSRTEPAK